MSTVDRSRLTVNGAPGHAVEVETAQLLVYFLREVRGLTGDQHRLRHDVLRGLHRAGGRRLGEVLHRARGPGRRLRGHDDRGDGADGDELHPVQRRSASSTGCNAATARPGMVMATVSLLRENPDPTEEEVRHGARGQPLPLHRLPQHRPGGAGAPPRRPAVRRVIPAPFDLRAGRLGRRARSTWLVRARRRRQVPRRRPVAAAADEAAPGARPAVLIDIGRLEELRYVREHGRPLAIGALTRHDALRAIRPAARASCAAGARGRASRRPPGAAPRHDRRFARARRSRVRPARRGSWRWTRPWSPRGPAGAREIAAADFFQRLVRDRARARRAAERDPVSQTRCAGELGVPEIHEARHRLGDRRRGGAGRERGPGEHGPDAAAGQRGRAGAGRGRGRAGCRGPRGRGHQPVH